jgi:hypothetical protein
MTKQLQTAISLVLLAIGGMAILNGLSTPSNINVSVFSTSMNVDFSGARAASILIGAGFIIGALAVAILVKPKDTD